MTPAALDPPARRVLRALYELAQLDCPAHAGVLARAVQMRAIDVGRVLLVLDARGLASAEHARLTLAGLAVAARCEPLQLESARAAEFISRRPATGAVGPWARRAWQGPALAAELAGAGAL